MAKKAYLYCDPRVLNDATNYYIAIVLECLREIGFTTETVFRLKEIKNPDLIFTVSINNYAYAKLKFPFVKTIMWKQGLSFAEARMTRPAYKWVPLLLGEIFAIHTSDLLLFVSEGMNTYYRKYFFYKKTKHFIMPCFNMPINIFNGFERYNRPSFVYAGNVAEWQCINQILDTFAIIESKLPNATLHMYCRNQELIMQKAETRGIKNIQVKFVSVEELSKELMNYKYGFILREKSPVNYVATPTKMNSYLSSFLIPIFSDAVREFDDNIKLGNYTINVSTPLKPIEIAKRIIDFETSITDFSDYPEKVQTLYNSHYNREKYKSEIIKRIQSLF